ncbi:MAG: BrnT family toxin [Planctomycetes bacterium]|nr:BrnT family toxin [Planctomycetota bacterium]
MDFEWDPIKTESNRHKHRISFGDASTAFADPRSLTILDEAHSADEERWVLLGRSVEGDLLVVVHVDRGETIRIISARRATARERQDHEQA